MIAVGRPLQPGVRSVAEGGVSGSLALTEKGIAVFFRFKFLRRKVRSLVGTVAERLVGRVPAGAEKVGFTCFEGNFDGLLGCDIGFGHSGGRLSEIEIDGQSLLRKNLP